MKHNIIKTENYLLVVDESEINPLFWGLDTTTNLVFQYYTKREVKTTDKKIIAHLPLNGSPILKGVDLLPPLEQEDDVEKMAEEYADYRMIRYIFLLDGKFNSTTKRDFLSGYNKAKEKYKYTEEDIDKAYWAGMQFVGEDKGSYKEFIQSLSQPKMPIGFECEMLDTAKIGFTSTVPMNLTTTTPEGHTQWIGTYIYE